MTDRNTDAPPESGSVRHTLDPALDRVGGMIGRAEAATTREAGEFVQSAAICTVYEIETCRIALDRTRNPKVREAAQALIDDHTDNSARLEAAVRQSPKVDTSHIPPGLDRRRETMLDHMREAPEDEFNRTYLAQQVVAHAEAASLMRTYRDEGDCQVLRSFAAEASPVIERHLEHVKRLKTDMPR